MPKDPVMSVITTQQQQLAALINVSDNAGRIILHGNITEQKRQLLSRLTYIDEQYKHFTHGRR